ncbi:hypothetical protein BCR39DRAFT_568458 [Naematelia encephala]|uniref:Uncharacterized protein n=1 Tax=Naematelia encephala TaxID=71784 RepID=A0A1Y2BLY4_9TREE|nr:hypothetical protein BCR39DRAFT_568458 [Naematelia encephala]
MYISSPRRGGRCYSTDQNYLQGRGIQKAHEMPRPGWPPGEYAQSEDARRFPVLINYSATVGIWIHLPCPSFSIRFLLACHDYPMPGCGIKLVKRHAAFHFVHHSPLIYNIPVAAYTNGIGNYEVLLQLPESQDYVVFMSDGHGLGTGEDAFRVILTTGGLSEIQTVSASADSSCLNTASQNTTAQTFYFTVAGSAQQCMSGFELAWNLTASNFTVIPLDQKFDPYDVSLTTAVNNQYDWLVNLTSGSRFTIMMNSKSSSSDAQYGSGGVGGIYEVSGSNDADCVSQSAQITGVWPANIVTNSLSASLSPINSAFSTSGATSTASSATSKTSSATSTAISSTTATASITVSSTSMTSSSSGGTSTSTASSTSSSGGDNEGDHFRTVDIPIISVITPIVGVIVAIITLILGCAEYRRSKEEKAQGGSYRETYELSVRQRIVSDLRHPISSITGH